MSRSKSDRALRRLVADLAALHPEDISGVLGELDSVQRKSVEGLLRGFAGLADAQTPYGHELAAVHLSDWLRLRLETGGADITEQARDTLQRCTAQLFPLAPAPRSGLIGRMLSGGGAP